jgi:hypothetical protein
MTEQAKRGRLVGGDAFETEQLEPVDEAVDLATSWPTGETIEVRPLWSAP